MTLLLMIDLDFLICNNNLGHDNKEDRYCRRPRDKREEEVIL